MSADSQSPSIWWKLDARQQRATVYNLTTKKQLEKKATYGINQLVPFLNKYKGINVATDALSQDLREEFL